MLNNNLIGEKITRNWKLQWNKDTVSVYQRHNWLNWTSVTYFDKDATEVSFNHPTTDII